MPQTTPDPSLEHLALLHRWLLAISAFLIYTISLLSPVPTSPREYHTSVLTGYGWVQELLNGHPDRIRCELGMRKHVFLVFVATLQEYGLHDSRRGVTVEEQAAIFCYMCVSGLSIRHTGERFQRANETISVYFRKVLQVVSSPEFYHFWITLPKVGDPTSSWILNNPKFSPYFDDAEGAIDGVHIRCAPSREEQDLARNRKGWFSQNCLAACDWDLRFRYFESGWDGRTADSDMWQFAQNTAFSVRSEKYWLGDGGFASGPALLVPYRNVWYHLNEWARIPGLRPQTKEELFNLRHAQLRNPIERIFGIVKKRWAILNNAPEFSLEIQRLIPVALAALHNFIMEYDPLDAEDFSEEFDARYDDNMGSEDVDHGSLAQSRITQQEKQAADARRDEIATQMWIDYVQEIRRRGEISE